MVETAICSYACRERNLGEFKTIIQMRVIANAVRGATANVLSCICDVARLPHRSENSNSGPSYRPTEHDSPSNSIQPDPWPNWKPPPEIAWEVQSECNCWKLQISHSPSVSSTCLFSFSLHRLELGKIEKWRKKIFMQQTRERTKSQQFAWLSRMMLQCSLPSTASLERTNYKFLRINVPAMDGLA